MLPPGTRHETPLRSQNEAFADFIVTNRELPAWFPRIPGVVKFLLFCILLVLCWPLALVALVMYPIVWLLLLPFRLVGIAVGGALELVWAIVTLPARLLRALA